MNNENNVNNGCMGCFPLILGVFFAGCLSYKLNGDMLWAFIHSICNWFYIVYKVIFDWKEVIAIFN